jgi:putative nucleotidyltransferase with HDIG domain
MTLVPWLAAVLLLDRSGALEREILFGFEGLVILLMIGSAFAGYAYVRHELGRTLSGILTEARRAALVDHSRRSNASADELARISEALARIDERLEAGGARFGEASGAPSSSARTRLDLGRVVDALLAPDQAAGLARVLEEAIRALDANTAYLVVPDEARGEFVTSAVAGAGSVGLVGQRAPLGEGVPAAAARERTPLLLSNPERPEAFGEGTLADASTDVMAIPLFSGEALRGVLVVQEPLHDGGFRDEDLREAAQLASLVVAAMDRASPRRASDAGDEDDRVDEVLRMFARAIDERNPYTRGHSERVARYCEEMGKSLGFDEESLRLVRRAALLHDVGKLLLPESIVRKEERLNDEELELMRTHVARAEAMVRRVAGLEGVAPLVRHHHERCDGSGYPDRVQGADLPLAAHVLIVANAFDIMTSDRSYRQAASLFHALRVLQEEAGTKYDRRAVQALCSLDRDVLTAPTDLPVNLGSTVKGQGSASISILD